MLGKSLLAGGRARPFGWLALLVATAAFWGWALGAAPPTQAALINCTVAAGEVANDGEEQTMLTLINQYRAQNGRPAWKFSPNLNRAAAWKSHDMGAKNYFSHNDLDGRSPYTRMSNCEYNVSVSWGENIAAGYADAANTLNLWKNSPSHNALLLDTQYGFKVAGIGRYSQAGSTYTHYWTLNMGGFDDSGTASATATPTPTAAATATPRPATPTPTATPRPWWCVWAPQWC
jgi:uncharacterized protein YkwD